MDRPIGIVLRMKVFHIREKGLRGVHSAVVLLNNASLEGGELSLVLLGGRLDGLCVWMTIFYLLLASIFKSSDRKE